MLLPSQGGTVAKDAAQASGQTSSQAPTVVPGHQKDIDLDIALGKKYAAEVDKQYKPTDDPKMQARVERIGNQLAAIANSHHLVALWGDKRFSPFTYHFKVLKSNDVNAFSLPGGYVYVYEGLVKYVESDDELAAVLGHEISHAAFRHVETLTHKSDQLSLVTIPLILLGLFTSGGSGGSALALGGLLNQAEGSGWSIEAEEAADYGGFQILTYSKYNPVGMLTFMERLARDDKAGPQFAWGIFRDHPPSFRRAEAITKDLEEAHIPIERSKVASSFCAVVQAGDNGVAELRFNGVRLFGFAGDDAMKRADDSVAKVNAFFDKVPEVYEAHLDSDGNVVGRGELLIQITDADAAAAKLTRAQLSDQTLKAVKGALYTYGYRVWQGQ